MTQTETTTMTKLRPLGNRVLARRLEAQEMVKGGIILPDSAKQKNETLEVVAVGPGKREESGEWTTPCVKAGDKVLMEKYAGQEVKIDDEDYVIVRADDIIAIIEE
jgi:chaperonin GroES